MRETHDEDQARVAKGGLFFIRELLLLCQVKP
jgi:hypothetical protein